MMNWKLIVNCEISLSKFYRRIALHLDHVASATTTVARQKYKENILRLLKHFVSTHKSDPIAMPTCRSKKKSQSCFVGEKSFNKPKANPKHSHPLASPLPSSLPSWTQKWISLFDFPSWDFVSRLLPNQTMNMKFFSFLFLAGLSRVSKRWKVFGGHNA